MENSIGVLRCEYLVHGSPASAQAPRLDGVARDNLAAALDRALVAMFGADSTVYLLREVRAELALQTDGVDTARRWAEALATAIAITVAEDPGDGANLVTFPSEADYLARYLADHIRGHAEQHWYFGALQRFHRLPMAEVLPALLRDRSADAVFAALHRHGTLPEVLAALPAPVLTELVSDTSGAVTTGDDLSGLWPLLVATVRVAELWSLWKSTPCTALDVARLYDSRPVPDWRDPAALSLIVLDVLRYLTSRGELRRPTGEPPATLSAEFDWLDLPLLVSGLGGAPVECAPTPRERSVLDALRVVISRLTSIGTGPRAVILLRAALAAEYPEWTDDPLAGAVVARVVARATDPENGPDDDERQLAELLATTVDGWSEASDSAGVLLLLRAVADLRLPAVLTRAGLPEVLPATLLAVAMRLTGAEVNDPAVRAFAGQPDDPEAELELWRRADADRCAAVGRELDAALRGQRITDLGEVGVLVEGHLGVDHVDDLLGSVALAVLRAWSRWLGRFSESSVPYLLTHFIRRQGRLRWREDELLVELDARPLDVIVRQAGYDQPIDSVPWLRNRRVRYRMDDG